MSAAAKAFASAVTKQAKSVRKSVSGPIAGALGRLVGKRLARRSERPLSPLKQELLHQQGLLELTADGSVQAVKQAKPRRKPLRSGRLLRWRNTTKVDISRLGTFRHYLISTVRAHDNSWDALSAHKDSEFASKKLDIAWVAAEGYIELI